MCIKLSNECTRCLGAAALAGSGAGRRRARLRRAGPRTANRAFRGACGSAVGGLSRPEVGLDAAPSGRARRPAPPDGGGYPPRPLPRSGAAAEPPIRNSQHMVRWTSRDLRTHTRPSSSSFEGRPERDCLVGGRWEERGRVRGGARVCGRRRCCSRMCRTSPRRQRPRTAHHRPRAHPRRVPLPPEKENHAPPLGPSARAEGGAQGQADEV